MSALFHIFTCASCRRCRRRPRLFSVKFPHTNRRTTLSPLYAIHPLLPTTDHTRMQTHRIHENKILLLTQTRVKYSNKKCEMIDKLTCRAVFGLERPVDAINLRESDLRSCSLLFFIRSSLIRSLSYKFHKESFITRDVNASCCRHVLSISCEGGGGGGPGRRLCVRHKLPYEGVFPSWLLF